MSREASPMPAWPRLLNIHLAAQYCSVGEATIRDWIGDDLLTPVQMPGSTIRRKKKVISKASRHHIAKILLDRQDLDALIDGIRSTAGRAYSQLKSGYEDRDLGSSKARPPDGCEERG